MKTIICVLVIGTLFITAAFADDGDYDMPDVEQLASQSRVTPVAKEWSSAPSAQKSTVESGDLKEKLKLATVELSKGYETDNTKEIKEQEFRVWHLKRRIAIVEKKEDFVYLFEELKRMNSEYPNSLELKSLVLKTKKEIEEYIRNANKILELEARQKRLDETLEKVHKIGSIIRQKELLEKMQKEYDNS